MGLDKKLAALHSELDAAGAPRDEADVVDRLVRERVDAFRSASPDLIRAFCHRWGIKYPDGPAFLVRVHRHRSWAHSGLSDEERDYSRRWLDGRARELGELFWDESKGLELEAAYAKR